MIVLNLALDYLIASIGKTPIYILPHGSVGSVSPLKEKEVQATITVE